MAFTDIHSNQNLSRKSIFKRHAEMWNSRVCFWAQTKPRLGLSELISEHPSTIKFPFFFFFWVKEGCFTRMALLN